MDEDVLKDLLRVNPKDTAAAEALSQLLESEERWESLAQHLLDRLEAGDEPRAMLYRRLASILGRQLSAPENALVVLLEGFEELSDDTLLGDSIEELAESLNAWSQIIEVYERHAAQNPAPLAFHRRLAHWHGRLGDMNREMRQREAVLAIEPTDVASIDILVAYYETNADWQNLARLLKLRAAVLPDGTERIQLLIQTGHLWADAIGAPDEALNLTLESFAQDPQDLLMPHIERYARMSGRWEGVVAAYQDALSRQEDGALCIRIARIYRDHLDNPIESRRFFALAASAADWTPSLAEEYRILLEEMGDHRELAKRLDVDLHSSTDDDIRLKMLTQRGRLLEVEGAYEDAIEVWFKVLEISPDEPTVLVRLIDAFRGAGRWDEAVQALKKLTVLEENTDRRAKYFHAIGVIQRDKLADNVSAVRSFDQALEFDPNFIRAFHALDELLMSEGNSDRRDRYYRRMLVRCLDNDLDAELIALIARNLGDLNRKDLENYEEALKAYDIALKYGEKDRRIYKTVAELEAKTGRFDEAEQTLLSLIYTDDSDLESYHALVSLHSRNANLDGAYNVCRVIRLLGHAHADEIALYESVKAAASSKHVRPLTPESWQIFENDISHPNVGGILELLTPALLEYVARSERAVGVSGQLTDGLEHAQKVTSVAGSILNLPVPEIRMSKRVDMVSIGHLNVPVIVSAPNLKTRRRAEQLFATARCLVLIQPRYYLATIEADTERTIQRVKALLATVHQWTAPDRPQPGAMPDLLALLNTLGAAEQMQFKETLEPLLTEDNYGIEPWLNSVEFMVNRIGFTICDDLESTVSGIRREANPLGNQSVNNRIMNILQFVISEDYRRLRAALALTVTPQSLASN